MSSKNIWTQKINLRNSYLKYFHQFCAIYPCPPGALIFSWSWELLKSNGFLRAATCGAVFRGRMTAGNARSRWNFQAALRTLRPVVLQPAIPSEAVDPISKQRWRSGHKVGAGFENEKGKWKENHVWIPDRERDGVRGDLFSEQSVKLDFITEQIIFSIWGGKLMINSYLSK